MNLSNNLDLSPVNKFPNHPSVLKIKSNQIGSSFSFQLVNHEEVLTELENYMSKTTQLEGIPTKIAKENLDVCITFLVKDIDTCVKKGEFPSEPKISEHNADF